MANQLRLYLFLGMALLIFGGWTALELAPNSPIANQSGSITVIAGGDVNLGRKTGQEILKGNLDYPFANIVDTLKSADVTFVNLESQLADLGGETQSPTSEYRFAGPPQGAISLRTAGIDIVSVANNHMWDYGKARLEETLRYLQGEEILAVGANLDPAKRFEPKITEVKGKKIAWLAMTNLLNGYENSGAGEFVAFNDADKLVTAITEAATKNDWVFVSLHTGAEYAAGPATETVELAHRLIDAGADAVIGHHPHVPQKIELYNEKPIFYSLGNFAFWQPFSFWTQNSFLVQFSLLEPHQVKYEIIPVAAGWQPKLLTDDAAIQQLMSRLVPESEQ